MSSATSNTFKSPTGKVGAQYLARGAAVDVWIVSHKDPPERVWKVFRIDWDRLIGKPPDDTPIFEPHLNFRETFLKDYHDKVATWQSLAHPNVVRVFGFGGELNLEVEYCENKCVREYLKDRPTVDKIAMAQQVIDGIKYLHGHTPLVVHGNLNAGKLFVDRHGKVLVGEFGLAAICSPFAAHVPTISCTGSSRWLSPELVGLKATGAHRKLKKGRVFPLYEPSDSTGATTRPTASSDVWALGCTLYEIFSETLPYFRQKNEIKVLREILAGQLPGRQDDVSSCPTSGLVWPIIMLCWVSNPENRPAVSTLAISPTQPLIAHQSVPEIPLTAGFPHPPGPNMTFPSSPVFSWVQSPKLQPSLVATTSHPPSSQAQLDSDLSYPHSSTTLDASPRSKSSAGFLPRASSIPSSSRIYKSSIPVRGVSATSLYPAVTITKDMLISEIKGVLTELGCEDLTAQIDLTICSDYPVARGGYGDVYHGVLFPYTRAAIKTLREYMDPDNKSIQIRKRAVRELYTWSRCSHPNILPLLGFAIFRGQIGMVSPWMENGSLPDYLERNPGVDRYKMCYQICQALEYLHSVPIIHGCLKGNDVLVSDEGVPMITDFGNSILQDGDLRFEEDEESPRLAIRWAAPEILEDERPSKEADIYALGMTILEIITGDVPYAKKSERQVLINFVKKIIPNRPEAHIPSTPRGDALWSLLTKCWDYDPKGRPSAREVTQTMKQIADGGFDEMGFIRTQ